MINKKGTYLLKNYFLKENHIPEKQWENRKEELLDWLYNFYDYELIEERPLKINIKEVIGEYQPLPRKTYNGAMRTERVLEATRDYANYTIASLGTEYKPNSKSKIARDAIKDFGYNKYAHTNKEEVVRRYIKKPFDENAQTNNKQIWVWYHDYTPLAPEILKDWKDILAAHRISEEQAAQAFYRQEQGEDITEEKNYYAQAQNEFAQKYESFPVLVREWCKLTF